MSSRVRVFVCVSLLATLCLGLAAWQQAGRRPDSGADAPAAALPRLVLLYAPCTVTTATLGPYNPDVEYTPELSRFARSAVVFRRHHGEAGRSAIDYAALFTGTQAMRHGVFSNMDRLPDDVYTVAEAFRDAGYDTYFWAAHPFASKDLNFAQGVDDAHVVDGNAGMGNRPYHERRFLRASDPRFRAILARLQRDPTYRALVLTNFSVTHAPYPAEYRVAFCDTFPQECRGLRDEDFTRFGPVWHEQVATFSLYPAATAASMGEADFGTMTRVVEVLYKSNFFYLDALFGAVVDAIRDAGLFDQSLIAFTADHGEVLYRPNARLAWSHGFQLAPEVLAIPLMISAPGLAPGTYESVSRSIDVLPTLLGLAHVRLSAEHPPPMGVDLAPALHRLQAPPALMAYSHSALSHPAGARHPDPEQMLVGVRAADLNYRHDPAEPGPTRFTVADWRVDPTAPLPHAVEQSPVFDGLMEYQTDLVRAYNGERARPARQPSLTAADLERLRQLGYAE
ncbi:MAG: sulfatase-like hydrolase/transferase [Deltaproteobacteria bacterium]|nr:sulfatase-like hydrolase/transferase [Deltaproteobacteria bacterium]